MRSPICSSLLLKSSFALLPLLLSGNSLAQDKLTKELGGAWLPSTSEYQQVLAHGRTQMILDIENDSLLLKKDDGFYTSGNHLILSKTLHMPTQSISYGWHFGQDLYTASDINLKPAQISPVDHPYAGLIYTGVFRELQNRDGSGLRLGLDLACLGPCAGGEWTQTNLHQALNQPLPQAWSTQLQQEWGLVLNAELAPARWNLVQDMDLASRFKVRVGNIFTDARSELLWRYGRLNEMREDKASFVFARAELRVSAYNATLQGGYFNKQTLAMYPRRVIPELEIGYQYRGDAWGFYASVIRRGSEIKELSNAKAAQNFAKIQFIYAPQ
jgi:lipid A 3-O-deacylase